MAKDGRRLRRIKLLRTVRDYGDDAINRLAIVGSQLEDMKPDERAAALRYFKSKYSAEWPSDSY